MLTYLGVWSLGLFSPTFFSTSSKKKKSTSTNLALEVVPGASLYSEALSPECGREHQGLEKVRPTRHVGAGLRGLLGLTAHGLLGR